MLKYSYVFRLILGGVSASSCHSQGFPLQYGGRDGTTRLYGIDLDGSNNIVSCGYSNSPSLVNSGSVPVMFRTNNVGGVQWNN